MLELKRSEIDTTKRIKRVAFHVTVSNTKNEIWGLKLYGENEDDLLLHLNWLEVNPISAEWKF